MGNYCVVHRLPCPLHPTGYLRNVCSFPVAITDIQLCGLRQHECIVIQFWRPETRTKSCLVWTGLVTFGGSMPLSFPISGSLLHLLTCNPNLTPYCFPLDLPPCESPLLLQFSLWTLRPLPVASSKTFAIAFRDIPAGSRIISASQHPLPIPCDADDIDRFSRLICNASLGAILFDITKPRCRV